MTLVGVHLSQFPKKGVNFSFFGVECLNFSMNAVVYTVIKITYICLNLGTIFQITSHTEVSTYFLFSMWTGIFLHVRNFAWDVHCVWESVNKCFVLTIVQHVFQSVMPGFTCLPTIWHTDTTHSFIHLHKIWVICFS